MARFHVNEFVAENAGKLIGAFNPLDQSGVNVNRSPGHGKGIELRVLHYEEAVIKRRGPHHGKEPAANPVDVALNL